MNETRNFYTAERRATLKSYDVAVAIGYYEKLIAAIGELPEKKSVSRPLCFKTSVLMIDALK